jgi:hypothetical protein
VLVRNGDRGIWPEGAAWQVVEEVRIGTIDSDGPESFGDITSFAVDGLGRIWVLDRLASELRGFDRDGRYVRSIGRTGSGPGEFNQPVHVGVAPEGHLWVMDPQNARLSVFDTAGSYLESIRVPGGFLMLPWPGGFDGSGFYYVPRRRFEPEFRVDLIRFDRTLAPLDTLLVPPDPVEREEFRIVSDGRVLTDERVPFQGGLAWRLSESGSIWALLTDQYQLVELDARGDTVRVVTKTFSPVPVTDEEMAAALDDLKGFVEQGGTIDLSRIPSHKPAVRSFFIGQGHLWVEKVNAYGVQGLVFDIFNPEGQYMGAVAVPFRLQLYPSPIVRDDLLYGVVRDEADVEFAVRARITKLPSR